MARKKSVKYPTVKLGILGKYTELEIMIIQNLFSLRKYPSAIQKLQVQWNF